MEALAARGDIAEALRVYDDLRRLLREELGLTPAPPLAALAERLLEASPAPCAAAAGAPAGAAARAAPGRARRGGRAPLAGHALALARLAPRRSRAAGPPHVTP